MAANPTLQTSDNGPGENYPSITCVRCHNAEALTIESIQPATPKVDGWVTVEYSCGTCETFYAHAAPVVSVARFLATSDTPSGVLQFGRYYIHCGEPMERTQLKLSRLNVTDGDLASAPAVRVPSAILRCNCGFQMTIPE